ncbi:hypothetical protein SDC9_172274 [bioreactor metagenome]|uniref:Uncharacterized protein n=1 Tax=bioreactor metagenome TaxID=1076179 RepID=A0A645GGG0_9ZZZZ
MLNFLHAFAKRELPYYCKGVHVSYAVRMRQPCLKRHPEACFNRFTVFYGAYRGASAQMAGYNLFAFPKHLSRSVGYIAMGCSMEPKTAYSVFFIPFIRCRIYPGIIRNCPVEISFKNPNHSCVRQYFSKSIYGFYVKRVVRRSYIYIFFHCIHNVVCYYMHSIISFGNNRFKAYGAKLRNRGNNFPFACKV